MISRKDPRQSDLDGVLEGVSADWETAAQLRARIRKPMLAVERALEDLVGTSLLEQKQDDDGQNLYRRIDATHARPYAEAALLAHFLRGGDSEAGSLDELTAGHFWDPRHRALFDVMRLLRDRGQELSPDLVLQEVHLLGGEAQVGGSHYVQNLPVREDRVGKAFEIVRTATALRQRRLVAELGSKAPTIGRFFDAQVEKLRRRARGDEHPVPLPFPKLAEALSGGLWPGVHILAAASGVGKTTLALMVALHASLKGVPVLYLGLEVKPEEMVARLLGLCSGTRWSDLLQGRDPEALDQATAEHIEHLDSLPFHFEVAPPYGWDIDELYDRAGSMRAKYPEDQPGQRPLLIVLDFLQIVAGSPDRHEDPRQRIARASYAAAAVARDFNASIVLVSSTARQSYEKFNLRREENKLVAELLGSVEGYQGVGKESGEIEYSADSLMVLVRISEPGEQSIPAEGATVYLGIAKQRAGATDWIPFRFDGSKYWEEGDPLLDSMSDDGALEGDGDTSADLEKNPYADSV